MNIPNAMVAAEKPEDNSQIELLADNAFGPGQFTRTAFRLREGKPHIPELSFVVKQGSTLIGSVRLTEILVGAQPVLLLGPLVVSPEFKGSGVGSHLMHKAIEESKANGHHAILLVGDFPYYSKFGFEQVPYKSINLPGPVDPARLLICYLNDNVRPIEGVAR